MVVVVLCFVVGEGLKPHEPETKKDGRKRPAGSKVGFLELKNWLGCAAATRTKPTGSAGLGLDTDKRGEKEDECVCGRKSRPGARASALVAVNYLGQQV